MIFALYFSRTPKDGDQSGGYLYSDHPQWRNYPHELLGELKKLGDNAVIVCKEKSYQGDNTFSSYWVPDANKLGYFNRIDESIKIDAILDKGYFSQPASFSMVNVPAMRKIGRDKKRQTELFCHLQPHTKTVLTSNLIEAINEAPTEKVVIKPLDKNGGKGVVIDEKQKVIEMVADLPDQQWIVQAFVDSSKGIPNIIEGTHDMRLYIIDGKPVLASVRQPKAGSLIANTSQGGTIQFFAVDAIPNEPITIAKQVDNELEKYGNRYYSVDFVYDGSRWYLLEINDRPGVPARFQSDYIQVFQERLAKSIADSASNPLNRPV